MAVAGKRLLKAAAAAYRSCYLPPGLVVAYIVLIAVLGMMHGRDAVLHPGEPITSIRGLSPVDLRALPSFPFAEFVHDAYVSAIAATGRTASWLRMTAAGEAHRRALQGGNALPSLEMNDGEYRIWWSLTDASDAPVDMAAVDAAARAWVAGDTTVARIPAPVNIRFAWTVNTTHVFDSGFDG